MKTTWKLSWLVLAICVIAQAAEAQVLQVTARSVRLRSEPTTASRAVATVRKGTLLEVADIQGSWYLVKVPSNGAVGYIHRIVVREVDRPAPPTAQPTASRPTPPPPAPQPAPVAPAPPPASQPAAAPPTPSTPPPAESYARTQSMEEPPDSGVDFTLWGGILDLAGSNLSGGAALGFMVGGPSGQIEVGGEYTRLGGTDAGFTSTFGPIADVSASANLLTVNGSFNYNFQLQSRVTPYASAGLVWARTSATVTASAPVFGLEESVSTSASETAFQFGGGLKVPIGDGGRSFRGDVRFNLFEGDTATRLFLGIVF